MSKRVLFMLCAFIIVGTFSVAEDSVFEEKLLPGELIISLTDQIDEDNEGDAIPVFPANEKINLFIIIHNQSDVDYYIDPILVDVHFGYELINITKQEEVEILDFPHIQRKPSHELTKISPREKLSLPIDLYDIYQFFLLDQGEYILTFKMDIEGLSLGDELAPYLGFLQSKPFRFALSEPDPDKLEKLIAIIKDENASEEDRISSFTQAVIVYPKLTESLVDYFAAIDNEEFKEEAEFAREYIREKTTLNELPQNAAD